MRSSSRLMYMVRICALYARFELMMMAFNDSQFSGMFFIIMGLLVIVIGKQAAVCWCAGL